MKWRHDLDPDAMTDEERRAKSGMTLTSYLKQWRRKMFGPKPAREDYPLLALYTKVPIHPIQIEVRKALDELDELRSSVECWESHVCGDGRGF